MYILLAKLIAYVAGVAKTHIFMSYIREKEIKRAYKVLVALYTKYDKLIRFDAKRVQIAFEQNEIDFDIDLDAESLACYVTMSMIYSWNDAYDYWQKISEIANDYIENHT